MAQHDYDIANQGFPAFRSDLNNVLEAINTNNSGTSRPSSAVAGTIWLDTTNATNPTLKLYDGADDISLATFDYSANTVNWLDSVVSGGDVVDDTTPQLGGTLDANGNIIDMGVNTITDTKVGNWDTAFGWGDHSTAGYLSNVVEDTTPQLGGNLDVQANEIVSTGANNIVLHSNASAYVE